MYSKRVKIFFGFCAVLLAICIVRLFSMQSAGSRQNAIDAIQSMRDRPAVQLPTLRGKILDRKGRTLAIDHPSFFIYVDYRLTRLMDDNWQFAKLIRKMQRGVPEERAREELQAEYADDIKTLYKLIDFCSQIEGYDEQKILDRIKKINDRVWWLRSYIAWRKYYPGESFDQFHKRMPDRVERIKMAAKESIIEMYRKHSLIQLDSEDDKFAAEIAFADSAEMIDISAKSVRDYPYNETASQLIGWVKPKYDTTDDEIAQYLANDPLASYKGQELAGFKGVEWVCESYLRGRRGRIKYNKDGQLIEETLTRFGSDVKLTIDIELQRDIEKLLLESKHNDTFTNTPKAAVIMDVDTGEILTLVSVPGFDLNKARENYSQYYLTDANKPAVNRAIEMLYPTGSTLKPLILIAAMGENLVSSGTVISCPGHDAPNGWPNCWIWRQFKSAHDYQWADSGGNKARNAIKGSCNIYFSHVANMLDSRDLQKWLYQFGFGRRLLPQPNFSSVNIDAEQIKMMSRSIPEAGGVIWTGLAKPIDVPLEEMPDIRSRDKKFFGIGQADMRATVLQVANEMSIIARGGVFRQPRIFMDGSSRKFHSIGISNAITNVVKDGMYAVVNETNGTARRAFQNTDFKQKGIRVYGKTGSTQNPSHAWFAGFISDNHGRKLALAVIVENGQSGSGDAAPLGREIVNLCIEYEYLEGK